MDADRALCSMNHSLGTTQKLPSFLNPGVHIQSTSTAFAHIHTCTHMYTHTYIYTYTHTYTYIHTYMHTHIYRHTYMYIYTHIYIHTYTYTHTHTHIYTQKSQKLRVPEKMFTKCDNTGGCCRKQSDCPSRT